MKRVSRLFAKASFEMFYSAVPRTITVPETVFFLVQTRAGKLAKQNDTEQRTKNVFTAIIKVYRK